MPLQSVLERTSVIDGRIAEKSASYQFTHGAAKVRNPSSSDRETSSKGAVRLTSPSIGSSLTAIFYEIT